MLLHSKKKSIFIFSLIIASVISLFLWKQQRFSGMSKDRTYKLPSATKKNPAKGCFVVLVRNGELEGISSTIAQIESTINQEQQYPYVFLNDEDFTDEFKTTVSSLTDSSVLFGTLDKQMWGYPSYINQTRASESRNEMVLQDIPYGGSESYRHMCRFQSGFFFRHPLLDEFDYYWRLEPFVDYYCKIDYDVFKFMKDNKKKYGFNIALREHVETIPTLWKTVMRFLTDHPEITEKLPSGKDSLLNFVSNDQGLSYNTCHFWSNFEIGDLSLWRSKEYLALFDYLDKTGGFFYERWGDAPVHTIAAALLLRKEEFHFFNDIGYRHESYTHCPVNSQAKCACDPIVSFDYEPEKSCLPLYEAATNNTLYIP